jgi:peptidoglycan hydrolase CwlO-like protein
VRTLGLLILVGVGFLSLANSKEGDRAPASSDKKVKKLESRISELEKRIEKLEAANADLVSAATPVTCFIETPFDGLYDSTDVNETKARIEAVKACMAKVKSRIHCSSEKVKCGK